MKSEMKRVGCTNIFETHVGIWEDDVDEPGMRAVFRVLLDHLRSRGWHVEQDPHTLEHFPTLADWRWVGHKGDLRMHAETNGRHSSVEFYQELHVENPNGGRYDFDKFSRMPRTMQLQCVVEMTALARKLLALGYTLGNDMREVTLMRDVLRAARREDDAPPLVRFNRKWRDRIKRDETGWPCVAEYDRDGRNRDRDGVPLRNGETRYFRQRGRLLRGTVYTNMGNMWMVVLGGSVTYEPGVNLFHCERPDLEPRRLVPGQAKRVRAELEKALKAGAYERVATLAKVCQRIEDAEMRTRVSALVAADRKCLTLANIRCFVADALSLPTEAVDVDESARFEATAKVSGGRLAEHQRRFVEQTVAQLCPAGIRVHIVAVPTR